MSRCLLSSSNQRLIAAAHPARQRCVHVAAGKGFGILKSPLKKKDFWK
jgi:DNA-nicking Smr family endonuclease